MNAGLAFYQSGIGALPTSGVPLFDRDASAAAS